MYKIEFTNKMQKDTRLMKKRGKDISKLVNILNLLANGSQLPTYCCDHQLVGNFKGFRECHIEPDWILIYQYHDDILILTAAGTGTHSDLFGK